MTSAERLELLLGRPVECEFEVVRWRGVDPAVVRNAPFMRDGTPMPTLYWLCDPPLRAAVSRIESAGGVHAAAAAVAPEVIAATHAAYAAERDALIDQGHVGPRPTGGVGGTRTGLKCLHAHVAYAFSGADDPVGAWTLQQIDGDVIAGLR